MSKLLTTFLLTLLACAMIMVGLGIYVLITFSQLANRTGVILRENYDSVIFMDHALYALDQEEKLLFQAAASQGMNGPSRERIFGFRKNFKAALEAEENNITLPEEAEAAKRLRSSYEKFMSVSDTTLAQWNSISSTAFIGIYNQQIAPAAAEVRLMAEKIRKMNHESMEVAGSSQKEAAPRLIIIGVIGAVLLLIAPGLIMARRLLRQAAELQTLRSHFLAIASHELRTPVTSLHMGLDILKNGALGELNPEQESVVNAGMEDCDRLLTLSRQLLDVTKIQSGQLQLHPHETDLKTIVSGAVAGLRGIIRDHRVTVTLDLGTSERLMVQADPVKLGWVMSNVLGNALRYAPTGSEIVITAFEKRKEAWVSVSDRGPGIPPDLVRQVFTPYYQADTESRGAVGLGLSISQEIIAAHGGRIWVEAQPRLGEGTTMTFSIPLAEKA